MRQCAQMQCLPLPNLLFVCGPASPPPCVRWLPSLRRGQGGVRDVCFALLSAPLGWCGWTGGSTGAHAGEAVPTVQPEVGRGHID